MRASKAKRQLLRSVRSMPLTAFEQETKRMLMPQYRMGPISSPTFAGGAVSIYAKREPKQPTGQQYPLSMFVKNDTTNRIAQAKIRRHMIRGKV